MFDYEGIPETMDEAASVTERQGYEVEEFIATLVDTVDEYTGYGPEEPVRRLAEDVDAAFTPEVVVRHEEEEHPDAKVSISYNVGAGGSLSVEPYLGGANQREQRDELESALEQAGFDVE